MNKLKTEELEIKIEGLKEELKVVENIIDNVYKIILELMHPVLLV